MSQNNSSSIFQNLLCVKTSKLNPERGTSHRKARVIFPCLFTFHFNKTAHLSITYSKNEKSCEPEHGIRFTANDDLVQFSSFASGKPVKASNTAVTKQNAPALSVASQLMSPETTVPVPMFASTASANVRLARIRAVRL